MITGTTRVIAHLGYPIEGFKAPMIYNPWFEARGIDAVVVPLVGEVVMGKEPTPLLRAAVARGLSVQVGTDMLFEMIPAYLEFFGFGTATADELRAVARTDRAGVARV